MSRASSWLRGGRVFFSSRRQHTSCALVTGVSDVCSSDLLNAPGVTVRPIEDLAGDAHFAEVFFEDVDLPADALIGPEGEGWRQVTAELAFERSGPERIYSSIVQIGRAHV